MHGLVDVSPESIRLQLFANATRGAGSRLYRKYIKKSSVTGIYFFHLPSVWSSAFAHYSVPNRVEIHISAK